jgi:hypothetical protein
MGIVIEDKAAIAQFMSDLPGSSKLYMRFRSVNGGRICSSAAHRPRQHT